MRLPTQPSHAISAPCAHLMPSLTLSQPSLGNSLTPHPPFGRRGGSGWSWGPPPFLPTPKVMLRKPHPDFPSWRPESLVKFAAEAATRMSELEAANEQLRQDLRDAMELIRQKLKNES